MTIILKTKGKAYKWQPRKMHPAAYTSAGALLAISLRKIITRKQKGGKSNDL